MYILLIFGILIATLAVLFAVQNSAETTVRLAFWESEQSLALVMLLSMAFGVVITLLVSTPSQVKNKLALRSQRKKISELEAGLAEEKSKVEELQKQLTQTAVETPNKEENTPTENKPVSTEKPK